MAAAMMGAEFTEGGRMTVPKDARSAPGIAGGARARASAGPARARAGGGAADILGRLEADVMARIAEAESAAAAGRVRRAESLSADWRSRIIRE